MLSHSRVLPGWAGGSEAGSRLVVSTGLGSEECYNWLHLSVSLLKCCPMRNDTKLGGVVDTPEGCAAIQ